MPKVAGGPNYSPPSSGGGGGGSALTVDDEGTPLDTAVDEFDFVGAGVTATNVGHKVTVTIGGGGSTDAADINIADAAGDFTATNVEDALAELQADAEADATALADHLADATDAHDASAVSFAAAGDLASTDVQAALEELDAEKQPVDSDLTTIAGLTATTDSFMQAKSSAWEARTIAQVKSDLGVTDSLNDHVVSGCVWTGDTYADLKASMTAGTVYIDGVLASVSSVSAHSFTASKDTYVDVDNTGALTYTEVANNAASPSLAAGSIRIAIIVSGGSTIANIGSINQGQPYKALPIASSRKYCVADSLGNRIYQTNPSGGLLSYRYTTVTYTSTSTTNGVDITALDDVPFIIPAGPDRMVKAFFFANYVSHTVATSLNHVYLRNGSTILNTQIGQPAGASYIVSGIHVAYYGMLAAGSYSFKASHYMQSAGTLTIGNYLGGYPNFVSVEYA